MKRAALVMFVLWFVCAGTVGAGGLPLEGYCRVGKYMPVLTDREVTGSGILPVGMARARAGDRILPVLVVSDQPTLTSPIAQMHPLADDQRLVGLVGAATEADAKRLFGDHPLVTLRLDWPLSGSVSAWETLDAVVMTDQKPEEPVVAGLLSGGVSIAVKSEQSPRGGWPWQPKSAGWWVLSCDLPAVNPATLDASPLLAQWSPSASANERRNVVLIAIILSILSLAATLRRGRGALTTLAVVAVGSMIVIGIWQRRQPGLRTTSGWVCLHSSGMMASDWWIGAASAGAGPMELPLRQLPHPIVGADEIQRLGMRLEVLGAGNAINVRWNGDPHSNVAFVVRGVRPAGVLSTGSSSVSDHSGLRAIAQDAYPGMIIQQDEADRSNDDGWGVVTMIEPEKKAGH